MLVSETFEASAAQSASEATVADGAASSAPGGDERLLRSGMEVGPYRLLEPVGMGGVGVVYAAYDPRLDRRVALKLLQGARRRTPEARQRLEREARAMAQLNHPNVITVHDVGEFQGEVYLTMEFAEGGTLKTWSRTLDTPRTPAQVETVLERYILAGRGLAAAHEAGLVHRDFKPDNVLLGKRGQVMVTDFGLVRAGDDPRPSSDEMSSSTPADAESSDVSLTRTGSVLGTPAFMSPEQHAGLVADAASDQFSFCVSLYEGLYGQRPFKGGSSAALALAVTEGELRDPPKNARVPERVRKVLLRGLSPQPQDRWPSMNALLDELMRSGLQRGIRAPLWIAGGIVAALGIGIFNNVTRPPAPCTGEAQAWAQAWNADAKARAKQAFEATNTPYALASFERISAELDAYGGRWQASHRENCEATQVHAVQSERLMDLRTVCLERRRDQVATLASILSEVEAKQLSGAEGLLADLGKVEACDDKEALLRSEHQFELDTPLVRELRDALSRAELLRLGGRYDRAKSEADAALAKAREAEEPVLIAEAHVQLGRLADARGKLEEAREHLDEAILAALEARQLGVAGVAWSDLVGIVGFELGEPEQARRYADRALAAFAASEGDHEAGIGRVHNGLGMIAYGTGKYELAKREFEQVLAINERRFGPEHPRTADVLNNLGAIAYAMNDIDASEGYHRRCLAIWQKAYGDDHPDIATAYNNLATIAGARGQIEASLAAHRDALRIRMAAFGPEHSAVAMSHYNIGLNLEGEAELGPALEHLTTAAEVFAKVHGDKHQRVAAARTGLGRVLVGLGRVDEAMPHLEAALAVRSAEEGDPSDLGETKFALAMALVTTEPARARELANEAFELYGADWPEDQATIRKWLDQHASSK